jgi:integrase/recombinase XerD
MKTMGKLQEQMKADHLLARYRPNTTRAYLHCIRNIAKYFMRTPAEMGETEVRQFILHLAQERKASASVHSTHVTALKFLYRITLRRPQIVERLPYPKRPQTLPQVLTRQEVLALFTAIQPAKYKAILAIAYGAGLRVSQVCALKPTDIDSQRMLIHVRRGKGNNPFFLTPLIII